MRIDEISMNTPLISIVIPVYKTEPFLKRCLDSVVSQTYSNWECICINDGSPDNSAAILAEYQGRDTRFKIAETDNIGVGAARNAALDLMEGEYFIFIDSDDFVHPQLLEICVMQILRDESDIVIYNYDRRYRKNITFLHKVGLPEYKPRFKRYDADSIETVVTDDIFSYVVERPHWRLPGIDERFKVSQCYIWRSLYRKAAMEGLRFCPGIMFEDFPWWGEVLYRVRKATISNLPLYYYYPNKRSFLMSSNQEVIIRNLESAIPVAEKVYEDIGTPRQKAIWRERFVAPFKKRLERKIKKYK